MRVFVTGANGFVGSAIVADLIQAGHTVLGLARSDGAADAVSRMGAEVHRGDISDPESLSSGARVCDGVIHTAYNNEIRQERCLSPLRKRHWRCQISCCRSPRIRLPHLAKRSWKFNSCRCEPQYLEF
jgi:UDP-glucose 4-epimerase